MSSAWLYQKIDDVSNLGEQAPWYVYWYEPDGRRKARSFGPGPRGKKLAETFRRKTEAELLTGTYNQKTTVLWDDFVAEYDRRVLSGRRPGTRDIARRALAHFKRIIKPVRVYGIDANHVDEFVAKRRQEPG